MYWSNAAGLYIGQMVHFGSVSERGGDLQNGLRALAADPIVTGYGRLVSRAAGNLVFDRIDAAGLQANIALGAAIDIDLVFGDFINNVARDHADYLQYNHSLELVSPDLLGTAAVPVDGYEYALGQVIETLTLNFPLTNKATMDVSLIGQDVLVPRVARQTGANASVAPQLVEALNTSADFARLRITGIDDEGIHDRLQIADVDDQPADHH